MKKIENEVKLKELYKFSDIDLLRYFKREPSSIAFYPLAKRLFTKKKYKESIQILNNGIKNHGQYIEPKILLAKTYIKIENYVEAVQSLRDTIKFAPKCAESYYYLSEVLFKKGINERAEILLTKAYELAPHLPDIKNSFEKRFKNSASTTTAAFNIESTVIESIDDIKRRAVKELYQNGGETLNKKNNTAPKQTEENILDELEKEFSYKKNQMSFYILGIIIILGIIGYIIFSISNKDKEQERIEKRKRILIALNTNIANINKEIPNNFPDITLYYKLLYHYQVDSSKYNKAVETIKNLKTPKNQWLSLAKMTYFLFNNELEEFNKLYTKIKSTNKAPADIFLLKGYQLLVQNDKLNSQALFDSAYKKSNNANRFKVTLASLYLNRGALEKLKSLETKPTSLETRLFYEVLRKSTFKEQEPVFLKYLLSTKNNIQKEKIAVYLINLYIKNGQKDKAKEIFNKELKKTQIPYYIELYKLIEKKLN